MGSVDYGALMDDEERRLKGGGTAGVDYGAMMDAETDNKRSRLAASVSSAFGTAPDAFAKNVETARRLGVPTAAVEALPEESQRRLLTVEADRIYRSSPKLAAAMSKPDFAKLVFDDSAALEDIESRFSGVKRAVTAEEFSAMTADIMRKNKRLGPDEARALVNSQVTLVPASEGGITTPTAPKGNWRDAPAALLEKAEGAGETIRTFGRYFLGGDLLGIDSLRERASKDAKREAFRSSLRRPVFPTVEENAAFGGLESTVQQLPGLAMSAVLRNATIPLAAAGLEETADSYVRFRERGAHPLVALPAAIASGAVEVLTERLPMQYFAANIGRKGVREFTVGFFGKELPGEQLATFFQDAIDTATANPGKTWGQFIAERPGRAYETFISTLVQTGVMGGVGKIANTFGTAEWKAKEAEEHATRLIDLMTTASQAKLFERSPATMAEFLQSVVTNEQGEPSRVWVSPSALVQAGVDIDQLSQASSTFAAQVDEALDTEGFISMPVGEIAVVLPQLGLEQAVVPHLKASLDDPSSAEAKTLLQSQVDNFNAEAERAIAQSVDGTAMEQSRANVEQEFLGKLKSTGRFTDAANEMYAKLVSSFYTTTAARLGVTPEEMVQRYPLNIRSENVTAPTMDQNEAGAKSNLRRGEVLPATQEEIDLQSKARDIDAAIQVEGDRLMKERVDAEVAKIGDPELRKVFANSPSLRFLLAEREGALVSPEINRLEEERRDVRARIAALQDQRIGPPEYMEVQRDRFLALIETPEWKEWLKGSKVVDSKGRPLIGLHGTTYDISAFATVQKLGSRKVSRNNWLGQLGSWFAVSTETATYDPGNAEATADVFAELRDAERGVVYPVFLSIKNPMEYEGYENLTDARDEAGGGAALRKKLIDQGYDGVVVRESDTDGGQFRDDWVAFYPEQIKSVFNTRPTNDPNILKQSVALRRGSETLKRFGLDKSKLPGKKKFTTRQVAAALENRQRTKFGSIARDDRSPEAAKRIGKWMVEEIEFEFETGADAVGWYSEKFQRALDAMGEAFPELLTDRNARDTMTALIAVTSDGQKVFGNFAMAVDVYANWKSTGKFTTGIGAGTRLASIDGNLKAIQEMHDELGPEKMRRFLLEEKTVGEINAIRRSQGKKAKSGYTVDTRMPFAVLVFGPKLGAFYANLMGSHGYLTMDRWWSRTFNRYRGILLDAPTRTGLDAFKAAIGRPEISDEEAIVETVPYAKAYEAKGFKNGTDLEKQANTLYKAAFVGLNDAPFNASDRSFMLEATKHAQRILRRRGREVSIADIQAILWYYEKRLYGTLGAKEQTGVSYEDAAKRVIEARRAGVDSTGGLAALDADQVDDTEIGEQEFDDEAGDDEAGTFEQGGVDGRDSGTDGTLPGPGQVVQSTVAGGTPEQGWAEATRISRGGAPRLVHRGASVPLAAEHFDPRNLGVASGNPSAGLGVWFTLSPSEAETYGDRQDLYLDLRNPLVVKVEDLPGFDSVEDATVWREQQRAAGYDGIIVTARHLGGRVHIVAFDAKQAIPGPLRDATLADFTPERIGDLLDRDNWAILTAENPGAQKLGAEENAARNAQLREYLTGLGLKFKETIGSYGSEEHSFIVTGVTPAQALEIGRRYGQQAVLVRHGLLYEDGTLERATDISVHDTKPGDYWTQIPDTGAIFTVNIDFDGGRKPANLPGVTDNTLEQSAVPPAVKQWAQGTAAADAKGNPIRLYHATTRVFSAFDKSKADPSSNLGAGFYLTDTIDDAVENYTEEGPDVVNRIERLAEQIGYRAADNGEDLTAEEAIARAREQVLENKGVVMPVFLRMRNPVRIGGPNETFFDHELVYDDTGDIVEERGLLRDFLDALREVAESGEFTEFDYDKAVQVLMSDVDDFGGFKASSLEKRLRHSEGLMYAMDAATGEYAAGEVLRRAFERMGYDGIVDATVTKKFQMEGMKEGTRHFVAFRPEQIKSVFNMNPTDDPDLLKQGQGETVTLVHYSRSKGITQTDPTRYGTGLKGAEAKRKEADSKNWVDRTYFGFEGAYAPEPGVGGEAYVATVPLDRLYDFAADPQGLRAKAKAESSGWDNPVNRYEKLIKEAGFLGYWTRNPSLGFVAAVFDPLDVTPRAEALAQGTQPAQPARGNITFANDITSSPSTITLLKNADLSTFVHELGHFQLEVLTHLARQPNAPAAVVEDLKALLNWFGLKDIKNGPTAIEQWSSMTLDQKRPHHEKFARGFEGYLYEGTAPSEGLKSVFARVRAWMISIYRSFKQLNVELTPEVRGVFDRLLATNEEIKTAEAMRGYTHLFNSATEMGAEPEEWVEYQNLGARATVEAAEELGARSLRDMQWTANARARHIRKAAAQAKERRAEVEAEVTAEVRAQPVYAVQRFLRNGELPGSLLPSGVPVTYDGAAVDRIGGRRLKLDLAMLREEYGEDANAIWRYLSVGENGLAGLNGLDPKIVAEMFGFQGTDHLVKSLLEAEPEASVIEGMTDQRMLERYADLVDPSSVERAANEAVHNEARGRFVATELNALQRAMTVREKQGKGSVDLLVKAARDFAKRLIAGKKVRDLHPAKYEAAAARASKAAQSAKGLTEKATEKRNQLVNHYAARASAAAVDEVRKGVEYLKSFDREGTRKNLDAGYLDQIDKLLERFELRQLTLKAIDKRKALAAWIQEQRDQGHEPTIPEELQNEASRVSYRDMTVEQFRGLIDSVKNIEHLARLKKKLLLLKDKREFDAVVKEFTTSIVDNATGVRDATRSSDRGLLANTAKMFRGFFAAHRKFASFIRQMDGWKDNGTAANTLLYDMNARGNWEAVEREKATIALTRMLSPIVSQKNFLKRRYFDYLRKSFSKEEIIGIALNTGNEINLERVVTGEAIPADKLKRLLDENMTKADWDFVQGVWDQLESYKPEMARKEKALTGVEPEWVEPTPVVTPHGVYRGGYYPIKYDIERSTKSGADAAAEVQQQIQRGLYTRTSTRKGHLKERSNSTGRPLRYDFASVIVSHVDQVLHDLAWAEYLIDANRLLRAPAVDTAIRTHYGPESLHEMSKMLRDIAVGDVGATEWTDKVLRHLRTGATVAGLGWRLSTALLQPLGLTQSMVRIGSKWVIKGAIHWANNPVAAIDTMREKSEFMRLRGKTMQREINEIRNVVSGEDSKLQASYFYMIQKLQTVADLPTWWGAYEKAMADPSTAAEAKAIALADQAVIDAQGSGQIKDLSGVQRGSEAWKLFTNFYSFFSTTYNLTREAVGRADLRKPGDVALLATDLALLTVIPALLSTLLKAVLSGDWDDPDKLQKKLIADQMNYALGTVVLLREINAAVQAAAGLHGDYGGPAGLRFFGDLAKLAKQAGQGEADAAFWKSLNNVGGNLFHYPSGQINATLEGAFALAEGNTQNPGALVVGPPSR